MHVSIYLSVSFYVYIYIYLNLFGLTPDGQREGGGGGDEAGGTIKPPFPRDSSS